MNKITLLKGDCLEKLKELEDNSVDSVVTDPPYGLEFMGKEWDKFKTGRIAKYKEGGSIDLEAIESRKGKGGAGPSYTKRAAKKCRTCGKQEWSGSPCKCDNPDFEIDNSTQLTFQEFSEAWAKECYRVLKPGGHLLAFAGSRMYHRLAVGVEDAGFEIRDQIMWIYGSGFPKSHNIGKAVDKLNGVEIEKGDRFNVVGGKTESNGGSKFRSDHPDYVKYEAQNDWNGWGTALKPAHEPIVMARKPFKGNVANNVLEWGTGGINVDGCRVGNETIQQRQYDRTPEHGGQWGNGSKRETNGVITQTEGRFPANIIFDEEAGKILDEQSGITYSGPTKPKQKYDGGIFGGGNPNKTYEANTGGASRFFYCPKSSKKDRNEGCDALENVIGDHNNIASKRLKCDTCGKWAISTDHCKCENPNWIQPETKNNHPTVKPTDLMAYLIRLITPKGGLVLDPFMGSGSTGKAAVREGMSFIGIEREDEYMEIAKSRIEYEQKKNKHTQFFDI